MYDNAGNLAFGKPAYSSSRYTSPLAVVDSNLSTIATFDRWISVDLGAAYDISRIVLWNSESGDCCAWNLRYIDIRVGFDSLTSQREEYNWQSVSPNQLVWSDDGQPSYYVSIPGGILEDIIIEPPVQGRWVVISSSKYVPTLLVACSMYDMPLLRDVSFSRTA